MSAPLRLAGFAAVLVLVFAGAALAGGAIDADRDTYSGSHGADDAGVGHGAAPQQRVRGLAIAEHNLRIVVDEPELPRGRSETLRFRVVDRDGATVRDFDVAHQKRMHLILARRDLTGFQHLHPKQAADGSWSTNVRLDAAGSYRLFADFTRDGRSSTLAFDIRVDGAADLRPLPRPGRTATSDLGYDVRLDRVGSELRFTITRAGRAVRTEPYLGAGGHLVVLRDGDLAFLHVHPTERGGAVSFDAEFPTAGRYRLFLQFKHAGRVHTVAFTQEVPER